MSPQEDSDLSPNNLAKVTGSSQLPFLVTSSGLGPWGTRLHTCSHWRSKAETPSIPSDVSM